jgi:hypothetical protein
VTRVPYRKIAEEALADWRDADRRLANMTPDEIAAEATPSVQSENRFGD